MMLMNLVNDLLDYSRLEVGQVQLKYTSVSLPDLIKKVVDPLRITTEKKGVKLSRNIDTNVPEMILTDELRLKQILTNVLGNAVKFTSTGSIDLLVKLTKGPQVKFVITDTGPGVPPEKHDVIFEPFKQADNSPTTTQYGGTGLGLAISKSLAETFGGSIKVKSNGKYGASFIICIPYLPAITPVIGIPDRENTVAFKLKEMKNSHLLVAEDNHLNQRVILRMLDKLGLHADIANTGKEAVQKASANNYSLILMDIEMPELDGYAATSLIRKLDNHKTSPIIAFTAHVMNEMEKKSNYGKWFHKCVNKTSYICCTSRSSC